jgi:hypothetical protein
VESFLYDRRSALENNESVALEFGQLIAEVESGLRVLSWATHKKTRQYSRHLIAGHLRSRLGVAGVLAEIIRAHAKCRYLRGWTLLNIAASILRQWANGVVNSVCMYTPMARGALSVFSARMPTVVLHIRHFEHGDAALYSRGATSMVHTVASSRALGSTRL